MTHQRRAHADVIAEHYTEFGDEFIDLDTAHELRDDAALQGYPGALGRSAVEAAIAHQRGEVRAEAVIAGITGARKLLSKLVESTTISNTELSAAGLLNMHALPSQLRDALDPAGEAGTTGLPGRLADPDSVPDEVVLKYLYWHNMQLSNDQIHFEQYTLPAYQRKMAALFFGALQQGWMPSSVAEKVGHISRIPTYLDDGVETTLDKKFGSTDGTTILLSPHDPEPFATYDHEVVHVFTGTDGTKASGGRGLQRLCTSAEGVVATVIDEAVTERIAQALIHGGLDKVPLEHEWYPFEQDVLDALCRYGVKQIDLQLFVNAYFESGTLGVHHHRLRRAIEDAFPGKDVLFKLTHKVLDDDYKAMQKFISQLQPRRSRLTRRLS